MRNKSQIKKEGFAYLYLSQVDPPANANRSSFDPVLLEELAASIRKNGVLEPVCVKEKGERFEIVFGHRRLIAAQYAEISRIPAIIVPEGVDPEEAKYAENAFREDLSPLDEANAILRMKQEGENLSNKQVARRIGRSEAYVSQRLAIFSWPKMLIDALESKAITFSVARELSYISEPALDNYLHAAVTGGCTPGTARMWRQQWATYQQNAGRGSEEAEPSPSAAPSAMEPYYCTCCRQAFAESFQLSAVFLCPQCKADTLSAFEQARQSG